MIVQKMVVLLMYLDNNINIQLYNVEQQVSGQYPPRIKLTVTKSQLGFQISYPIKFVGCNTKLEIDLLLSTGMYAGT